LVHYAFSPRFAAMAMRDPLDGRQADAGAFKVLRRVKALEHTEQFVDVSHVEPDAIVANE
jgi:hypothetical protein